MKTRAQLSNLDKDINYVDNSNRNKNLNNNLNNNLLKLYSHKKIFINKILEKMFTVVY